MRLIFVAAVLCLKFVGTSANADLIVIDTSVGMYEVTTVEATTIDFLPTLMDQVWWGNSALAQEFAEEILGSLGIFKFNLGPRFAYEMHPIYTEQPRVWAFCLEVRCGEDEVRLFRANSLNEIGWAVARKVPEPGTLGLLVIGLIGMGLARRRSRGL